MRYINFKINLSFFNLIYFGNVYVTSLRISRVDWINDLTEVNRTLDTESIDVIGLVMTFYVCCERIRILLASLSVLFSNKLEAGNRVPLNPGNCERRYRRTKMKTLVVTCVIASPAVHRTVARKCVILSSVQPSNYHHHHYYF